MSGRGPGVVSLPRADPGGHHQRSPGNILHDALRATFELVTAANRYADSSAPWQLAKARREATAERDRSLADTQLRASLSNLVAALRVSAELLAPFLPSTARGIRERLVPCPRLAAPLFPALRPA